MLGSVNLIGRYASGCSGDLFCSKDGADITLLVTRIPVPFKDTYFDFRMLSNAFTVLFGSKQTKNGNLCGNLSWNNLGSPGTLWDDKGHVILKKSRWTRLMNVRRNDVPRRVSGGGCCRVSPRQSAFANLLQLQIFNTTSKKSAELSFLMAETLEDVAMASQDLEQETPPENVFKAPSIHKANLLSGKSYSHFSPIPSQVDKDMSTECVLGVDEAGRGPVLGRSNLFPPTTRAAVNVGSRSDGIRFVLLAN